MPCSDGGPCDPFKGMHEEVLQTFLCSVCKGLSKEQMVDIQYNLQRGSSVDSMNLFQWYYGHLKYDIIVNKNLSEEEKNICVVELIRIGAHSIVDMLISMNYIDENGKFSAWDDRNILESLKFLVEDSDKNINQIFEYLFDTYPTLKKRIL